MLTDTQIRGLKPREKPYKKTDSRGLYVIVNPSGALWWRFKYRYVGREKLLSLGTYPDTSLKLAREKRDQARKLLAQDIDPSAHRQAEKTARTNTLSAIAEEWFRAAQVVGRSPDRPMRSRRLGLNAVPRHRIGFGCQQ